ncbi:cupin domain-containing protein [Microbacterium sp. NPDC090007]|uniref:cupin domain-containing protein n=1 Tax=Microbacterium sp. NPDC090007 TaxID=3364204 RepID=UPI003822D9AF
MSTVVAETEFSARATTSGSMIFAVPPNASTGGHSHPSRELWIVRAGTGHVLIDGIRYDLVPSEVPLVITPDAHHRVFADAEELVILSFWWKDQK